MVKDRPFPSEDLLSDSAHASSPADLINDTDAPPGSLWSRMRADPHYAPEHLALEAVRRLGPEAATWALSLDVTLTPEQRADAVVRRFTNLARISGAVSGATGLPGAVLDVGVLAWTQARMVMHLAAAYGADPTSPDRAIDLLVLQGVHKVAETARLALGVAAGRERASRLFADTDGRPIPGIVLLGVKLARMAGVHAARRLVAKMVPGAAIMLGTWANSTTTKDLARRTRERYRTGH
jgi:EcsC protein family